MYLSKTISAFVLPYLLFWVPQHLHLQIATMTQATQGLKQ